MNHLRKTHVQHVKIATIAAPVNKRRMNMDKKKLLKNLYTLLSISFWITVITGIIRFPELLPFFGVKVKELPLAEISWLHRWSGVVAALSLLATIILKKKMYVKKKR